MSYKTRTEIRIETSEVMILRKHNRFARVQCPRCNRLVAMISIAEAASISGQSEREIYRLVEDRQVHFVETRLGRLLICLDSFVGERR